MKINQGVIAGKDFNDIINKLSKQDFIWYLPITTRLSTVENKSNSLYKKQTVENCLKDIYIDSNGNVFLTNKLNAYKKDKENSSLNFYSFEARFNEDSHK